MDRILKKSQWHWRRNNKRIVQVVVTSAFLNPFLHIYNWVNDLIKHYNICFIFSLVGDPLLVIGWYELHAWMANYITFANQNNKNKNIQFLHILSILLFNLVVNTERL